VGEAVGVGCKCDVHLSHGERSGAIEESVRVRG
jgi:hypothetical protein